MQITVSVEAARGCGYRKAGKKGYGMYLMDDGPYAPCGRLPFELTVCPCCGEGVKPSRAPTWINPGTLFTPALEIECDSPVCYACPMGHNWLGDPALLLWIGEKFYPTADHFRLEANRMGLSRRISALPNGFVVGETWVFLAHRKTIPFTNDAGEMDFKPGVFMATKPKHVDMVIDNQNDIPNYPRELQEKLGEDKVRIVEVIRDHSTQAATES